MAKRTIITDRELLHQKSEPVDPKSAETLNLLHDLCDSLPDRQLGLSAPQINTLQRVFIAWLPALNRRYGFVNPRFEEMGENTTPSTEGCLSLPGVMRTVERCACVVIDADRIVELSEDQNGFFLSDVDGPLELNWTEAVIVQHEYDHLEGKLLVDLPTVQSTQEKMQERNDKRKAKIHAKRQARKRLQATGTTNISAKKPKSQKELKKAKQQTRKARKREQKRVEIKEKYKAQQEGLFDPAV
jgi:peptide deformylase